MTWELVTLVLGVLSVGAFVYVAKSNALSRVSMADVSAAKAAAQLAVDGHAGLASRLAKVEHALRIDTPMKPTLPAMMR